MVAQAKKNVGVLQTTHSKAAEAGHHLRLVLQVRGLDGANQLLPLGQPGVKQMLMGQNKRGEDEEKNRETGRRRCHCLLSVGLSSGLLYVTSAPPLPRTEM